MRSRDRLRYARGRIQEKRISQLLTPREQLKQLRYVPRALGLVWSAAPVPATALVVLIFIMGILPGAMVYQTRSLVDGFVSVMASTREWESARPLMSPLLLFGILLLAGEVFSGVASYLESVLTERTQDHMQRLIQARAISVDMSVFESPDYYDLLRRASTEAIDRPLGLLRSLGDLLQNVITLLAMIGVLLRFTWWMPAVLVTGTLPALWVTMRATWQFHLWRKHNSRNHRRLQYMHQILTSDSAAAELRLFQLGHFFMSRYQRLSHKVRDERLYLSWRQMQGKIGAGLFGFAAMSLSFGWVGWRAVQGAFSMGELAMFWQAMNQGQRLMRGVLTGMSDIYRNLLFLEDLFTFLELEPILLDPAEPIISSPGLNHGICLEQVVFGYPGSGRKALQNFNLTIPAGQIVAIVGVNGAGKSTLIKLLCRFYDPDGGRVTWDGIDLHQMAMDDLRRRITVLFQRPLTYHDTASNNIAFGDIAANPNQLLISTAAVSAGADTIIDRLPEGYDTLLGKWFGYAELSIGEWQRLALARAFIRQADFVILDEPTSSMDSWAEAAWLGRFRNLVAGRTALIITHRFTSAMQADIIHVMDQGQIVESGSHDDLVALGGRYASSWQQQMRDGCRSE